ncbi:MAG: AraC family transcriptional regulator [Peptostreptococcaceae bacterium]|jgi:AraC family transcriptional regulator|nr:AraC family transcriptional regulator [Peptostreptococcaceae bacterium]
MQNFKEEYLSRVNLVMDYIENNLQKDLTIEELSDIACFSRYHFSRIFKSITGEGIYQYIKRIRLQRAIHLIRVNKNKSITDIAMDVGFNLSSNFSYAFKKYYGLSPSQIRNSTNSKVNSIILKVKTAHQTYNEINGSYPSKNILEGIDYMTVEIKEIKDLHVAYVRSIGDYNNAHIGWDKLSKWAQANNIIKEDSLFFGISYDDPEVTPIENLRYDSCITVDKDVKGSMDVGINDVPGGKFGVLRFFDVPANLFKAYKYMFGEWLPSSGYEADDRYCLEFCISSPHDDEQGRMKVDLYIPIRPL